MIFKKITGFPKYKIYENGDIVSSHRVVPYLKKPTKCKDGYYRVQLRNDSGASMFLFHRLICIAFNGPPPSKRHETAHMDGNKENNHYSNLKWLLPIENTHQKYEHGTMNMGETSPTSKLKELDILKIRELYASKKYTQRALAKMYNVHFANISCIILKKSWKHI